MTIDEVFTGLINVEAGYLSGLTNYTKSLISRDRKIDQDRKCISGALNK